MTAVDGWEVASAVAALVATGAAVVGLFFARASARAGRDAAELAKETVTLTRQYHTETERDRRRARLEHVGSLIETLHAATIPRPGFTGHEWEWERNTLAAALVGLELPITSEIVNSVSMQIAQGRVAPARQEVNAALQALAAPNHADG
jgi:hypothetical protein